MSSEDIIRDISVFYYYVFNDEEYAFQCAKKTADQCLKRINNFKKKEGSIPEAKIKSLIVYFTDHYFKKLSKSGNIKVK